jgi:hypothetical protein
VTEPQGCVECVELLAEVRALEVQLRISDASVSAKLAWRDHHRALLQKSNDNLRAQLAEWEQTRTTGGPAAPSNAPHWTNVAAPPPPSASDESAPPLRRSETSSSFRGGESRG